MKQFVEEDAASEARYGVTTVTVVDTGCRHIHRDALTMGTSLTGMPGTADSRFRLRQPEQRNQAGCMWPKPPESLQSISKARPQ
jgi:hypothetical protein